MERFNMENVGVHGDRPITTADDQPMNVTTIPSHWGCRLCKTSVLKLWIPIATMKKNDPNCPICLNAPKRR
jgi:hypothetical protein